MKKILIAAMITGSVVIATAFNAWALVLPIFSGSTNFAYVGPTPGLSWAATVDWEAYAPNVDPGYGLGSISDYAYYYIVHNTSPLTGASLSQFSVGVGEAPITDQDYLEVGGIEPYIWQTSAGSSKFYFFDFPLLNYSLIPPGSSSDRLYLTSPWIPGMVEGGLIDGGGTNTEPVVGPVIPEPATMMLLGMGILGLVGLKRKT